MQKEKQLGSIERSRNVPELRFPEFEDEWEEKKLNSLLEFKNGINASKEDYGFGYKFINVLDIIENDFITYDKIKGEVNVSQEIFEKNLVQYGDILFQRSSETREEVGQSNVYLDKENSATFGGFVIRGKKIAEYEPFFFHLLLKTSIARKEITTKSGGSTRYNVGQDVLSSVKLSFPSLPEQQKTATFLTAIDNRLQSLEKKKSLLEEYKKGVMQQIFKQELRFKIENKVGELVEPPEWEEKKLKQIATITTGSSNRQDSNLLGKYTFFDRSVDIRTSDIFLFDGEAIIIAGEGSAFTPKYFKGKFDLHQRTYAIMNFTNANGKFLYHYISYYKNYFLSQAVGSTVKSLRLPMFQKMPIILPSIEEQTKIANFLSAIDKKIELVSEQIEKTKTYKKGLLQQMFV